MIRSLVNQVAPNLNYRKGFLNDSVKTLSLRKVEKVAMCIFSTEPDMRRRARPSTYYYCICTGLGSYAVPCQKLLLLVL